MKRSAFFTGGAAIACLLFPLGPSFTTEAAPVDTDAGTLYVFYPSVIRPQVMQKKLSDVLPGVSVTVFGRYTDFAEQLGKTPPDVVLSKPDALLKFKDFSPAASGVRNSAAAEPYYLVSVNSAVAVERIEALNIGVIDFLGREGMDSLAHRIFPAVPKLKRVMKVEDLLPLLSFGVADAVLVSGAHAAYLAATSNLKFYKTELPDRKIGIVGLSVKKNIASSRIINLFKKLSSEQCAMFDIDVWR